MTLYPKIRFSLKSVTMRGHTLVGFYTELLLISLLQIKPLFEQAEAKNKLLRSVAGGGVDSLNHLLARWDKFELMMESHQLMVKEQVISLWG